MKCGECKHRLLRRYADKTQSYCSRQVLHGNLMGRYQRIKAKDSACENFETGAPKVDYSLSYLESVIDTTIKNLAV